MAKRMKKTLPSKTPDVPPVLAQDPLEAPSRSSRIMDGLEKLTKGMIAIRDAASDVLYVNFEKTNRILRVIPNPELKKQDRFEITFYTGPDYGWQNCHVAGAYPVIPNEHPDAPDVRAAADPAQDVEKKKARAAHLPKFKKVKPDPTPEKADGKRVFKGKLNGKNVLFDAGDGSTIAVLEPGLSLPVEAKKLKREYVSQGAATPYAIFVFTKQWQAQK